MDNHSLQLAATKVAALFGRQLNCRVVFKGNMMACDEHAMYFPAWDMTHPETYDLVIGVVMHEAGHRRFDDFTIRERWLVSKCPTRRDTYHVAKNILADVRLEHHMMRAYPGARVVLDRIIRHVIGDPPLGDYTDGNAGRLFFHYALVEFRYRTLAQEFLREKRDVLADLAGRLLGDRVLQKMEEVRKRIVSIGPDQSAYPALLALADDLVDIFDQAADEHEPAPDQRGSENPPDSAGKGDSPSNSQGGSSDSSDEGGQNDSSSGDGDAADDGQNGHGDGDGSSPSSSGQAPGSRASGADPDAEASASGGAKEGGQDPASNSPQKGSMPVLDWSADVNPTDYDPSKALGRALPVATENYSVDYTPCGAGSGGGAVITRNADADYSRACELTRSVRASLADLLQSREEAETLVSRRGRVIASGRITRMFGDGRMFARRTEEEAESLSLSLLIDVSGSTSTINGQLATATMAVAKALSGMDGVERSVYGFPSPSGSFFEILGPAETDQKLRRSWPVSSGGTPLFASLEKLVLLTQVSDKTRKAILCLTDGVPDQARRAEALDAVRRFGVEFYGVVIGTPKYDRTIFHASRSIAQVSDLPRALEDLVREIVRRTAA